MTAPLLDMDCALDFLDGDADLCVQLLNTLSPALDEALDTLPSHIAREEWSEVGGIAHRLIPSMRIFCPVAVQPVMALNELSRQADRQAMQDQVARTLPLLQQLASEIRDNLGS